METKTNTTQLAMTKVRIGSGYIQFVTKRDVGEAIVAAAETLGFDAKLWYGFAGCKMANDKQKRLVFAKLREAAREQGYASLTFDHTF